jgi:chemotaxis protein histidine kinase CheA
MSIAASAENTMFKKVAKNEKVTNENEKVTNENEKVTNENEKVTNENEKVTNENEKVTNENEKITEQNENENEEIHDSDDDMIVITIRETCKNQGQEKQEEVQEEAEVKQEEQEEPAKEVQEVQEAQAKEEAKEEAQEEPEEAKSKKQEEEEAQKEEELFFELKDDMEKKKLFPIMPCNMVSAFGCAMEHVEYLDIKDVERKALAIELVKCLAYINNEYGARECFDYLFQNNMTDDIVKTIIDCTKNRYDINKYPHTNRNIMLSCVSLSKKVKNKTKPKIELLEELFDFKFNLCGLKRFFRIKDDSKNV